MLLLRSTKDDNKGDTSDMPVNSMGKIETAENYHLIKIYLFYDELNVCGGCEIYSQKYAISACYYVFII